MTSKNNKAFARYTKMNASELAAATADLDEEFAAEKFRQPTAKERQSWQRAKRGRPTVGKGAKIISISIEAGLLDRATKYATTLNIKKSALIAESLREFMDRGLGTKSAAKPVAQPRKESRVKIPKPRKAKSSQKRRKTTPLKPTN